MLLPRTVFLFGNFPIGSSFSVRLPMQAGRTENRIAFLFFLKLVQNGEL